MQTDRAVEYRLKTISRFLKKHREKAKLTQQDVSKKLGYTTPQFISNWERGVSLPPTEVMGKLRNLYGFAAEDFIVVWKNYAELLHRDRIRELKQYFRSSK